MSIVHTYYEPVPDIDQGIQQNEIAVWRDSWERWGWECKVLGRADVVITPDELARLQRLPSVNPPGYDLACYLRWFAMRALGGGLMSDYDVVNVGMRPTEMITLASGERKVLVEQNGSMGASPEGYCLCAGRVPCAMLLSGAACILFCDMLVDYEAKQDDLFEGKPHVSDMTIFQRKTGRWPILGQIPICQEPQHADERTRLMHISHNAMAAMGLDDWHRHDVMRVLAQLGAGRADAHIRE